MNPNANSSIGAFLGIAATAMLVAGLLAPPEPLPHQEAVGALTAAYGVKFLD